MSCDERVKSGQLMLVRHGEGRANVDRVIAGLSGCAGLTELGRRQVRTLSARWAQTGFRPDVLVSSPVRRARETAEILAGSMPGLGVVEDCAPCEMLNGEADGLTWQDYDAKYGALQRHRRAITPFRTRRGELGRRDGTGTKVHGGIGGSAYR